MAERRWDDAGSEEAFALLDAVHRVAVALHRGGTPAELYDEAVDAVITVLGVDRASLLIFDPDRVMRFKAWRGLSADYRAAVQGHSPWVPGQRDARSIAVDDVLTDPELAGLLPVLAEEGIAALAFVPLIHDGGVVGKFMLYYDSPHRFSTSELAVAEILAAHAALALDRRRHDEALERARGRAETAAARLSTLAKVTAELSRAASVEDVAGVVLSTALSELGASRGSLCLRDGDELEIAYSVGYSDDVMGYWRRFSLADDLPASEAVRSGRPVLIASPAERDGRYPVFTATPVISDPTIAVIPLGEPQPFGCLVVSFAEARTLNPEDESFFVELAARCAAALERAQLFAERNAIAETLQASLLPPDLPDIPGVDVAARYLAAGRGVEVGGDFYDVFRLDAHRFVFVLGDVCGRGVDAASLAALCRHTVRSAAVTVDDPAGIVAHLNDVVVRHTPDAYEPRFCTVVVGVGSLASGHLRMSLALGGHPPPLVRRADGAVMAVGKPGFVVGVTPNTSVEATTVVLGPGEALVCVTDGVLERRRQGQIFGDARLAQALTTNPHADAATLAASIQDAVVSYTDHEVADDLAVLVIAAPDRARTGDRNVTLAAAEA